METTKPVNFTIEVTRAQIRAALLFAADKDIRYYLNGVCLHVGECGDARLVATDGHRLAVVKVCDQSTATPGEYIIPREYLKAIKKASRTASQTVFLTIEGDSFRIFDIPENAILCGSKLIDGKFPDWQRVATLPDFESLTPGAFNAAYLADIQKALKELGGNGFYCLIQNRERGAVVADELGFMCVVMALREDYPKTAPDITQFMPRRKPTAIIETATGGQAFPCDPLQDVTDKREQQTKTAPEVVAHCGAELAAWLDPAGALQKAGLLIVAHVGDHQHAASIAPPLANEQTLDADYLAYLASVERDAVAA